MLELQCVFSVLAHIFPGNTMQAIKANRFGGSQSQIHIHTQTIQSRYEFGFASKLLNYHATFSTKVPTCKHNQFHLNNSPHFG